MLVWIIQADPIQNHFSHRIKSNVQKAHESFLKGDLKLMALNVRNLLEEKTASIYERKNVLSLISRAQNLIGDGSIPTDWKVPHEVRDLVLSVQTLVDPNGTSHQLIMEGFTSSEIRLQGLQILDADNRIILNSKDHESQFTQMAIKGRNWSKFNVRTELNSALAEGLYFFNINLSKGSFEGWFIYTEAKTMSPREYSKRLSSTSLFQLSTAEGTSQKIIEHKQIVIKPTSRETQENEYKVMQNAANQNILVMKRREEFASKDFLNMRQEDRSPNVLRMNHNTTQSFGDLTIRRLIATEVLIDK